MRIAIDKLGRVVLPKSTRMHLGVQPGDEFELEEQGECVVLKFVSHRQTLERKNGVLVFTGEPTGDIEFAQRQSREDRHKAMGF